MLSPFRASLSLSLSSRFETLDSTVPFLFVPAAGRERPRASGAGSRPATVSEGGPLLSSPLLSSSVKNRRHKRIRVLAIPVGFQKVSKI
jgi:hypothetical protein